ncbi:hypothetical protein ColKHC_03131 [Colletotrichum higginsianum]|nr:hypothetical protein ColKHC_03131 [Colletotrichum higginsianum]
MSSRPQGRQTGRDPCVLLCQASTTGPNHNHLLASRHHLGRHLCPPRPSHHRSFGHEDIQIFCEADADTCLSRRGQSCAPRTVKRRQGARPRCRRNHEAMVQICETQLRKGNGTRIRTSFTAVF